MCEESASQTPESKKVYILLTKQTDPFSRIFGIMSGCRYFHASIGFEERGTFFSFNTKRGFCIEQPSIKRQFVPCMLYSLDVSDEIYDDIEERIRVFREREKPYTFSYFGMFLCIFRMPLKIPFLFNDSYFCSMFVSELIVKSGATKLKVKPHRYLPRHFPHEPNLKLCFEGVWGEPPEYSEDGGDLYSIPVRYAKRYVREAGRRAHVTVKMTRHTAAQTATRTVHFARRRAIHARDTVFRAPGKFYIICRDNLYTAKDTATKASREAFEALERWWMS
ncbi:MAG: hypothetical protein FWH32_04300 [Clostridiales bacterium]|nr:hypothetical protein [Clostridiales bacterium]